MQRAVRPARPQHLWPLQACGAAIPDDRLLAVPAARFCLEHQAEAEVIPGPVTWPGPPQGGQVPTACPGTLAPGSRPSSAQDECDGRLHCRRCPFPGDADPPPPFVTRPVDVAHVVVPLDGSPFAERALPVAAWVAAGWVRTCTWSRSCRAMRRRVRGSAIRYLDSVAPVAPRRGLGRGGERGRGGGVGRRGGRPAGSPGVPGQPTAGAAASCLVPWPCSCWSAAPARRPGRADGAGGDRGRRTDRGCRRRHGRRRRAGPGGAGVGRPVWGGGWMSSPWPSPPAPDTRPGRTAARGPAEPERYLDSMAARARRRGSRSGPT